MPGRVRSRQCAGPGGGSANCGEVGGLARADIRIEHWRGRVRGGGDWRDDKRSLNQHNFIKISLEDIRAVSVRKKTTGMNILASFELVLTVFRHPLNIKG